MQGLDQQGRAEGGDEQDRHAGATVDGGQQRQQAEQLAGAFPQRGEVPLLQAKADAGGQTGRHGQDQGAERDSDGGGRLARGGGASDAQQPRPGEGREEDGTQEQQPGRQQPRRQQRPADQPPRPVAVLAPDRLRQQRGQAVAQAEVGEGEQGVDRGQHRPQAVALRSKVGVEQRHGHHQGDELDALGADAEDGAGPGTAQTLLAALGLIGGHRGPACGLPEGGKGGGGRLGSSSAGHRRLWCGLRMGPYWRNGSMWTHHAP